MASRKENKEEIAGGEFSQVPIGFCNEPMILLDERLRVVKANEAFYSAFELKKDVTGEEFFSLKKNLFDVFSIRQLIVDLMQHGMPAGTDVELSSGIWHVRGCLPGDKKVLLAAEAKDLHEPGPGWDRQSGFLKQVLDTLPAGVWITDAKGKILHTNPMASKLWRGEAHLSENIQEYTNYKCVWPETGRDLLPEEYPIAKILLTQQPLKDMQFDVQRFDGSWGRFSTSGAPIHDMKGRLIGSVSYSLDITSQYEAQQQLSLMLSENRSQKDFLQILLDSTKAGIAVVQGDDLRFKLVNKTFRQLRPDLPMAGLRFRDTFPELESHNIEEQLRNVISTGESMEGVGMPLALEHQPNATWDYQLVRLPDEEGKPGSALIIIWETTQHKRLEKSLRNYGRQLAELNQELKSFSYSVSHDLRTPLITVDSFALLLQQDYAHLLDEEGVDYLARIRSATTNMHQLIEDMLVLSRINRKKIERENIDLSSIAKEKIEELQIKDPQRKVEFIVQQQMTVVGDPGLMRLLMQNLLGNAWKFTRQRENPRIEFGSFTEVDQLIYFVSDNGIGFSEQQAGKIFEPFRRIHGDDFKGSGIGLSIVQRIVKRHNGRIWAKGIPDHGAVFYFTLG